MERLVDRLTEFDFAAARLKLLTRFWIFRRCVDGALREAGRSGSPEAAAILSVLMDSGQPNYSPWGGPF
jgi:hypothetical protein